MPEEDPEIRRQAETLLESQRTPLRGYLRHLVGSSHDADDLLHDVFVAVLEKPQILLRGSDPGAYIRGIARHLASRHHRRIRRDPVLESIMEVAWDEPQAEAHAAPEGLRECMEGLSEKFRRILAWRYEELLNSSQIAQRLQSSPDAVRMALARARQALAKCLQNKWTPGASR